jgi:hypothetical protein
MVHPMAVRKNTGEHPKSLYVHENKATKDLQIMRNRARIMFESRLPDASTRRCQYQLKY